MKFSFHILILLSFLCVNSYAQTDINSEDKEIERIKKILPGEWKFVKTIDSNNTEVKTIKQDYKDWEGNDIEIVANGPDFKISKDGKYIKRFTSENYDTGYWELISSKEIKYTMVIPKDSRQGDLIKQSQQLLNKKWETDENGNYLDGSSDKIISISENELRIEYHKKYIQIYKKI